MIPWLFRILTYVAQYRFTHWYHKSSHRVLAIKNVLTNRTFHFDNYHVHCFLHKDFNPSTMHSLPELQPAIHTPQSPRLCVGVNSACKEPACDKPSSAESDNGITDTESVFTILPCDYKQVSQPTRLLTLMHACYAAHTTTPGLPVGDHDPFKSCFFSALQESVSYAAAMRAPDAQQWLASMNEEKESFFAIVRLLPSRPILGCLPDQFIAL